jgi:hypothetical protein
MSIENAEQSVNAPIYEFDLSEAWDSESQIKLFFKRLKKLGLYKKDLLYSGFNGEKAGKQMHSDEGRDIVFCSPESGFSSGSENPFEYATDYEQPAIAIYDPDKLKKTGPEKYIITDPTALIAIIQIK